MKSSFAANRTGDKVSDPQSSTESTTSSISNVDSGCLVNSSASLLFTEEPLDNCSASENITKDDELNVQDKTKAMILLEAGQIILKVLDYFVVPSGIILNGISMAVMSMKHNRKSSVCTHMAILAVADNALLLFHTIQVIGSELKGTEIYPCSAVVFSHHLFSGIAAYTIVSMTFDKFLSIVFPLKLYLHYDRARVLKVALGIVVSVPAVYWPLILTAVTSETGACTRFSFDAWYIKGYSALLILFFPTIPVAAIFCFNVGIIRAVHNRSQLSSHLGNRNVQERQVTVMLLVVSSAFVVLVLPFEIRDIVLLFTKPSVNLAEAARAFLTFCVTYTLVYLNSCVNFFLYLLSGPKFRNDLKTLFGCKKLETARQHLETTSRRAAPPHGITDQQQRPGPAAGSSIEEETGTSHVPETGTREPEAAEHGSPDPSVSGAVQ